MKRHLLVFALLTGSLHATTWYVLAGAAGSNAGTDWTNARTTMIPMISLTRGDTVYVGTGTYGATTFNKANSGTTTITIKHATVADHGTSTGWNDSFAGAATWTTGSTTAAWDVQTDYWVFNGQSRTTAISGYGFVINNAHQSHKVELDGGGNHTTFRYIDFQGNGAGMTNSFPLDDGFYASAATTDLTIQFCHFYWFGDCMLLLYRQMTNFTMDSCWLERNGNAVGVHSEAIQIASGNNTIVSRNITLSNNIFVDCQDTAVVSVNSVDASFFYNNLFYWTSGYPNAGQGTLNYVGNGVIANTSAFFLTNSFFYGNTVIIPPSGGFNYLLGGVVSSGSSGNTAQNNLFYCSGIIGSRLIWNSDTAHDFNSYSASGPWTSGEANAQTNIDSTFFKNVTSYDFTLAKTTAVGNPLGSPYNFDQLGTPRSTTTWARGAYEFIPSGPPTSVITHFSPP